MTLEFDGPNEVDPLALLDELDTADATPPPLQLSHEEFAHRLRSILALKSVDLEHCATQPILRLRPEDLPDAWDTDLVSVWVLLRRLAGYAGLDADAYPIEIEDGRTGYSDYADAITGQLQYLGISGGRLRFWVGHIGAPSAMIGQAALAMAWAWLQVQRTRSQHAGQGYRATNHEEAAPLPDESDAAIAALPLGFGHILANASYDPKTAAKDQGLLSFTKWVNSSLGLPVDVTTWGHALWLALTQTPEAEAVEYRRSLNPDQQLLFDDALAEMHEELPEWRERVGWPAELVRRPRRVFEQPPIDDTRVRDELALVEQRFAEAQRYPNRGQAVARTVWYSGLYTALGVFAGIGTCVAMTAALPGLFLPLVGMGIGRMLPKYRCADTACEGPMRPEDTTCARCGGTIVADVKDPRERLAAIEAWADAGGKLPEPLPPPPAEPPK